MRHNLLYVFDNLEFGGGERGFVQIINSLNRTKYKIMVACLPTEVFVEKVKGDEVQINSVDMRNRFNPMVILRLVNLMKRENVDIVHSQGARADFFARMSAKLAGAPIVISTVQMPVEGFNVSTIKRLIYILLNRFSERFVDRFIVTSTALEKTLIEKHSIQSQRIVKIYNGVEVDEYSMTDEERMCRRLCFRKELGLEGKIPIVGVIGRLVWQKGFEYFIEAIPEVLNKITNVRFLVVGEGVLKNELAARCKRLNLSEEIIFTGFRDDVKDILSSIDIFVMPSLLEGLPMVLLEAMSMAKPIAATDIEGIQEMLENGITGLLVPPRDPKSLSEAIAGLLNHRDKAFLIGATARKVVEARFRVDVMVQKVEEVYGELLRQNCYQVHD